MLLFSPPSGRDLELDDNSLTGTISDSLPVSSLTGLTALSFPSNSLVPGGQGASCPGRRGVGTPAAFSPNWFTDCTYSRQAWCSPCAGPVSANPGALPGAVPFPLHNRRLLLCGMLDAASDNLEGDCACYTNLDVCLKAVGVWACSGFAALLVPLAAPALPPPMHQEEWACDGGASNLLLAEAEAEAPALAQPRWWYGWLACHWQMPQSVLANTVKACELFGCTTLQCAPWSTGTHQNKAVGFG